MARRLLTDKLIHRSSITEEIRLIEGSNTDYITRTGKIYSDYGNNMFLPKSTYINNNNGYTYANIRHINGNRSSRVHILVAKAFIPNPNNLPYVGHKHNNKSCVDATELYWTDASENTKRAYADGKAKNAKGFDDSQSYPVDVYTKEGALLDILGSVTIASKKYNVSKSTVLRHCNREIAISSVRGNYIFRFHGESFR